MTEHDYLIAWGLYAVAASGCLLVTFLMTGWMWRYLKEPLRVLVAVLLFTPTIVDPAKDVYAPALAITALDLLFKVGSTVWTALLDLGMYALCAFIVYIIFVLVRWPIERKRKARQAQQQARQKAAAKEAAEEEQDLQPFGADDRYGRHPAPAMPGVPRGRVEPRL